MAKYKVIRFADNKRGIGAEVEKKTIFGTSTWVKIVTPGYDECFDKWVNKATGKSGYADICMSQLNDFYTANHITKE